MTFEEILSQVMHLTPKEKVQLIEKLAATLNDDLAAAVPVPKKSLLGLCEDLGPPPSAAEIDEVRREAWGNFPRDDI